MCTKQRCAEISLTKACMVSFPMWAKYKICKATTAWHGVIVLIDKLVICQTNFIEAYLVKNTWTSRNQNSLKSSCFHQSFIRRLTDLPNPDLAYLLVRCWNLFTEVPGCFLFNKVTFHFRMIFHKNREIGSPVVRPWEKIKNDDTHCRIVGDDNKRHSAQVLRITIPLLYCWLNWQGNNVKIMFRAIYFH